MEPTIFFSAVVVLVIVCFVLIYWLCKAKNDLQRALTEQEVKQFEEGDPSQLNPKLGLGEQVDLLPYDKKFEFPFHKLKVGVLLLQLCLRTL